MVGDCEGAGNGAGIRLSKVLGSGVGKFIRGGKKSVALGLRRGLELHVVPKHVRTCAEARFSVLRIAIAQFLSTSRNSTRQVASTSDLNVAIPPSVWRDLPARLCSLRLGV